jgi:hypothetical protein
MHCFEMQDWLDIRGSTNVTSTTQNEDGWLDLEGYRDVVVWTEVKEVTSGGGTVQLTFETSPTKDEAEFGSAVPAFTLAAGVTVSVVHRDTAGLPLARWLRWTITSGTTTMTWDAVFRVWIAAAGRSRRQLARS